MLLFDVFEVVVWLGGVVFGAVLIWCVVALLFVAAGCGPVGCGFGCFLGCCVMNT